MVKVSFKNENITKFLSTWDKEVYNLNLELRKINLKQKKEQIILQKNKEFVFRTHK